MYLTAVFLTSLSIISFQIAIMQALSIAQWHHFAWMVISMALLGFGAAGTVLFLFRNFLERHFRDAVPVLLLLTTIAIAGTTPLAGLTGTFDAFLLFFEMRQTGLLVLTYLLYALPFFFAGLAINLVFLKKISRIGFLYGANMVGTGFGAGAVIGILYWIPIEYVPTVLSLFPLAGGLLLLSRPVSRLLIPVIVAALILPAYTLLYPLAPEVSQYKDIRGVEQLPGATEVFRSDSPHGRLQILRADALRYAPGLSLHYEREPPVRDVVFLNGSYHGTLLGDSGTHSADPATHILDYTTRVLPYAARNPQHAVVLGAGTGTDVAQARAQGVSSIHAVEPDPRIVKLLHDTHPEWIDGLFRTPEVILSNSGVRPWLAQYDVSREGGTDLVVLPVIGAFGGTSGVDALQERHDLTVEAFFAMFQKLSRGGQLAATVWIEDPPRPSLKLIATLRDTLVSYGIQDIRSHMIAIRGWSTMTVTISNQPYSHSEIFRIRNRAAELGFDPLLLPDIADQERQQFNRVPNTAFFDSIDRIIDGGASGQSTESLFRLDPATDDRPHFFHFLRLRAISVLRETIGLQGVPYLELGLFIAIASAVQAAVAGLIFIILPLVRSTWSKGSRRYTLLFFSGTGAGFILFEIALIQHITLYLGQPLFASALVLAGLLISSGIGSLFSTRVTRAKNVLVLAGSVAALLIVSYAFLLPYLISATLDAPAMLRVLVTLFVTVVPGICLGVLFPLGLGCFKEYRQSHIPWACAIDSCIAVAATAPAALISLSGGVSLVMGIAGAFYLLVVLAAPRLGDVASP